MKFWRKLSIGLVVVFATVLMTLTAFCFTANSAEAKVAYTSEIHLFLSNEWETIANQSEVLNVKKKLIKIAQNMLILD